MQTWGRQYSPYKKKTCTYKYIIWSIYIYLNKTIGRRSRRYVKYNSDIWKKQKSTYHKIGDSNL